MFRFLVPAVLVRDKHSAISKIESLAFSIASLFASLSFLYINLAPCSTLWAATHSLRKVAFALNKARPVTLFLVWLLGSLSSGLRSLLTAALLCEASCWLLFRCFRSELEENMSVSELSDAANSEAELSYTTWVRSVGGGACQFVAECIAPGCSTMYLLNSGSPLKFAFTYVAASCSVKQR